MGLKLLESFIAEALKRPFKWSEFRALTGTRSLKDYEAMIDYADARLQRLGQSTRIAYAYSSSKVLKIARSKMGIEQNTNEIRIYEDHGIRSIVTKMYDYDKQGRWLLTEIVRPLTSLDEFKALAGIDFGLAITIAGKCANLIDVKMFARHPQFQRALSNPKVTNLIATISKVINEHNVAFGDIDHLEHWGKTSDGRVVLYDYGYIV